MISRVTDAITKHKSVSVNTNLNAEFMLGENTDMKSFGTRNRVLFETSSVCEWYSKHVVAPTLVAIEEFQDRDSEWTLRAVLNILLNINKHNPLRAGCYIPLPHAVVLKKAVVNVKSGDNACFLWAVVASLHPAATHGDRYTSYPHYATVLRTDDIYLFIYLFIYYSSRDVGSAGKVREVQRRVRKRVHMVRRKLRASAFNRRQARETRQPATGTGSQGLQTLPFRVHSQPVEADFEATRQTQWTSSIRLGKVMLKNMVIDIFLILMYY